MEAESNVHCRTKVRFDQASFCFDEHEEMSHMQKQFLWGIKEYAKKTLYMQTLLFCIFFLFSSRESKAIEF